MHVSFQSFRMVFIAPPELGLFSIGDTKGKYLQIHSVHYQKIKKKTKDTLLSKTLKIKRL